MIRKMINDYRLMRRLGYSVAGSLTYSIRRRPQVWRAVIINRLRRRYELSGEYDSIFGLDDHAR